MPETALHFSDVTFGFDRARPLFKDLSCSLTRLNQPGNGKIIALMGPSGVGKTTFCDLALGVHRPAKGSVYFEPIQANIGLIPQKGVIFDELDVRDNISCLKYSRTLGNTFREDRVAQAIGALGLSRVLNDGTRSSELSGGEAQRVMLARIQTVNCDALILDEPCSFLDNRVKDAFLVELRRTVDECGLLALMVTHVWSEAQLVADEVIFFHQPPGKAATLHRSPVEMAKERPPTLDALFGIHWPECAVLSVSEALSLTRESMLPMPSGARFLGVFHSGSPLNEDGTAVMTIVARMGDHTLPPRVRSYFENQSPRNLRCLYYDADGVLIPEAT